MLRTRLRGRVDREPAPRGPTGDLDGPARGSAPGGQFDPSNTPRRELPVSHQLYPPADLELDRLAVLGRAADAHWETTTVAHAPALDGERARLAMRACWDAADAEYARLLSAV